MSTCNDPAALRSVFLHDSDFHLTMSDDLAEPVIRITGDLDARTAPFFDRAYDTASERGATRVVVDLGRMTFIDSTGLRSIVRARARAKDRDSFVLRDMQPGTRRVLELSGLLDEFATE